MNKTLYSMAALLLAAVMMLLASCGQIIVPDSWQSDKAKAEDSAPEDSFLDMEAEVPDEMQKPATLDFIAIGEFPAKMDYFVGEKVSVDGIVIHLHYSNGNIDKVDEGFEYYPEIISVEGAQLITIVYEGYEASYAVNASEIVHTVEKLDGNALEVWDAKNNLDNIGANGWYDVNIEHFPEYNVEGLVGCMPGPVEIWNNHLHILFYIPDSEPLTYTPTAQYDFQVYFRPYREDRLNEYEGYEKAYLKSWSQYNLGGNIIYRCTFYDELAQYLVEGERYEMVVVAIQDGVPMGSFDDILEWTDSCAAFVRYAEMNPQIEK